MQKWAKRWKEKFKEYWRRIYQFTGVKLSRGSQDIVKLRTSAHNDNWRRKQK